MSEITVIYDGECAFCISSLKWVKQRVEVRALAFQSADLGAFNLTREQCAKELYVVVDGKIYKGAAAVAYLLGVRGNVVLAAVVKGSGVLGKFGYRWVAAHRGSLIVRAMKSLIE
jgi:predicted DCC family thiol-disulfide oxidoreductase YuxK